MEILANAPFIKKHLHERGGEGCRVIDWGGHSGGSIWDCLWASGRWRGIVSQGLHPVSEGANISLWRGDIKHSATLLMHAEGHTSIRQYANALSINANYLQGFININVFIIVQNRADLLSKVGICILIWVAHICFFIIILGINKPTECRIINPTTATCFALNTLKCSQLYSARRRIMRLCGCIWLCYVRVIKI
jgi:hypothetical protein